MKLAGSIMIIVSASFFGFRCAAMIRRRCDMIGQLLLALRLLKSELATYGTPMAEAFAVLAAASTGCVATYFSTAAKEMNHKRWISPDKGLRLAEKQLKDVSERDPILKILHDLGAGLGRYDQESQLYSIAKAEHCLERLQAEAERDRGLRCKTYRSIGICAGLALAILLV